MRTPVTRSLIYILSISFIFLLSAFAIIIYQYNLTGILRYFPNNHIPNPVTCVCFIASSAAFSFIVCENKILVRLGRFLGYAVLLTGFIRCTELVFHFTSGIDRWLYTQKLGTFGIYGKYNFMAPNTAIYFVLLGASLFSLTFTQKKKNVTADVISIAGLLLSFVTVVGHIFKANELYGIKDYIPIAFPTALSFFLFFIALLTYRIDEGIFRIFTKDYEGSKMARFFLPFVILVPFTTGLIRLYGEKQVPSGNAFEVGLFIIANVIIFVLLIWRYSYVLNTSSISLKREIHERKRLEHQLLLLNKHLERRVEVRSKELTQEQERRFKAEHDLLESTVHHQKHIMRAAIEGQEKEKKRIGMELHDNVNQILASTKLYIEMSLTHEDLRQEFLSKSRDQVAMAIEEIRNLSKSLVTPENDPSSLLLSIDNVISSFQLLSSVQIRKDLSEEEFVLLDEDQQVASYRIIQEQMNNIHKYARARNVLISLERADDNIRLLITDDGVGFDVTGSRRGIGLANIQSRTEALDGRLKIESAPGKGCRLEVCFPLEKAG